MLHAMHNGIDSVVHVYCAHDSRHCGTGELFNFYTLKGPQCEEYDQHAWRNASMSTTFIGTERAAGAGASTEQADSSVDFDLLLHRSSFAAVVPGEGTHSYRLLEVLQAGAIPVVIGASATPFADLIRWDRIGVVQRDSTHSALLELMERLRTMPLRFRDALRDAGQAAYSRYMSSAAKHIDGLFETLRIRYHRVIRRGGGEVPADWRAEEEDFESFAFYEAERMSATQPPESYSAMLSASIEEVEPPASILGSSAFVHGHSDATAVANNTTDAVQRGLDTLGCNDMAWGSLADHFEAIEANRSMPPWTGM